MAEILEFKGKLSEGSQSLFNCFKLRDELSITLEKLIVYAHMRSHEDTAVSKYQGLVKQKLSFFPLSSLLSQAL